VIGAVQAAGTAYNTFKGVNLGQVAAAEVRAGVTDVLRNTIPGAVRAQPNGSTSVQQRLQAPLFPTPPKR
jgi:riboflavin synthase